MAVTHNQPDAMTEQGSDYQRPVQTRDATDMLKRAGIWLGRTLIYALLCLIFLIPFAWMIFGSLRAESEIFQYLYPLSWKTFFPIDWTLEHYRDVLGLSDAGKMAGLNFGRNLANSFIVSTAVVISSLVFNTMGAYFFARLPFPKKNFLFVYVLVTLFVPFEITMVPLYIVVQRLGI